MDLGVELGRDAIGVEAELGGVADQVLPAERPARLVHPVVHLPERALRRRGLGRLGCSLGIRMDVAQREVPEGEQQPPRELVADPADDRVGRRAVRALEVAVHDQLELGAVGAVDVVLG